MQKKDAVRVNLRVPIDIDNFIRDSCNRIITKRGKTLTKPMTLNDAYVDFLWRGIESVEDDDEEG